MSRAAPRLGFWAPHQGPLIAPGDPEEEAQASFAGNLALIEKADRLGFDSVLIPQQTMNLRDPEAPVLEPWTLATAAALRSSRLEIIVAVKPLLYNVGVAAKHLAGLAEISGGRAAINVISGWFMPELKALGIETLDHEDRYAASREWLDALRRLLAGETLQVQGRHLRLDGLRLVPDVSTLGPIPVYASGESEPGRDLSAALADVYFMHPRPLAELPAAVADLTARAAAKGRRLKFGLSTRIFARRTEAEAWAAFERLNALAAQADSSRSRAGMERPGQTGVSRATREAAESGVVIVGDYRQAAEALRARRAAGIDLVMAQLQPLGAELERLAEHVFPLLEERAAPALSA